MSKKRNRSQRNPQVAKPRSTTASQPDGSFSTKWYEHLRPAVNPIVAGLAVFVLTRNFETAAGVLFLFAWAVGTIAVLTHHNLSRSRKFLYLIAMLFVLAAGFGGFWMFKNYEPEEAIPAALLSSQIEEFNDLTRFIGEKQENELRRLFDFPDMLRFNIAIVKRSIAPNSVTAKESSAIDKYFSGGRGMLNAKYGRLIRKKSGLLEFVMNPGKVAVINLSKQHLASRDRLFKFTASAQLPSTVREAVKEFNQAVSDNVSLLHEVLNEKLRQDPNNILRDNSPSSPYYSAITNDYWGRFIHLRPKAEIVVRSIRAYLQVE